MTQVKANDLVRLKAVSEKSKKSWPSLGQWLGSCGVVLSVEADDFLPIHVQFDQAPFKTEGDGRWHVDPSEIEVVKFAVGDVVLFRANPDDNPELATVTEVKQFLHSSNRLSVVFKNDLSVFKDVPVEFFRPLYLNKD